MQRGGTEAQRQRRAFNNRIAEAVSVSANFKKVCVATDFSEPAGRAFAHAVALADLNGAELHALHVLSDLGPVPGTDHRLGLEIAREYFNRLRERPAAPAETMPATPDSPPSPHVLEDLERQ